MKDKNKNAEENTNQDDWYNVALIFTKAIGYMLNEKEGIVIHLENDMQSLDGETKKVVLVNYDGMIQMEPYDGDLEDGAFLMAEVSGEEEDDDDDRISLDDLV